MKRVRAAFDIVWHSPRNSCCIVPWHPWQCFWKGEDPPWILQVAVPNQDDKLRILGVNQLMLNSCWASQHASWGLLFGNLAEWGIRQTSPVFGLQTWRWKMAQRVPFHEVLSVRQSSKDLKIAAKEQNDHFQPLGLCLKVIQDEKIWTWAWGEEGGGNKNQ